MDSVSAAGCGAATEHHQPLACATGKTVNRIVVHHPGRHLPKPLFTPTEDLVVGFARCWIVGSGQVADGHGPHRVTRLIVYETEDIGEVLVTEGAGWCLVGLWD